MKGLLYIIAVLLVIGWVFGFVVYHVAGFLIHLLLVVAVIMIIINLVGGKKTE